MVHQINGFHKLDSDVILFFKNSITLAGIARNEERGFIGLIGIEPALIAINPLK
ncbi:hypothetical protein SY94_5293 (plasmid) [Agrobacterium tumefaciens]|nr:hypothetical protein SY94_5293 [Agrobacterium tumefaciens]